MRIIKLKYSDIKDKDSSDVLDLLLTMCDFEELIKKFNPQNKNLTKYLDPITLNPITGTYDIFSSQVFSDGLMLSSLIDYVSSPKYMTRTPLPTFNVDDSLEEFDKYKEKLLVWEKSVIDVERYNNSIDFEIEKFNVFELNIQKAIIYRINNFYLDFSSMSEDVKNFTQSYCEMRYNNVYDYYNNIEDMVTYSKSI